jgi:hypothetical protein
VFELLDGKTMKTYSKDIWAGATKTKLNFAATLTAGVHVLEVYGAEGCCDGTSRWYFQVNDGKWLDFTIDNLDRQVQQKESMCCFRNFPYYNDQKCGCLDSQFTCGNG